MDRRQAIFFGISAVAVLATSVEVTNLKAKADGSKDDAPAKPFSYDSLLKIAQEAAKTPYVERRADLPDQFQDLTAARYHEIMFRSEASSWNANASQFSLKALPCGFLYETPVDIHIVERGLATPLMVDGPAFASPTKTGSANPDQVALPYSGLSLSGPFPGIEEPQPIVTFQGASYFKALAPGQVFGSTARGLAIKTAHPDGEEIPVFREYWIELPSNDADAVTIYALLDSVSTTGAYRFTLRPDQPTLVEVEMTLFPRDDIKFVGIAPLSSMFLFDEKNHRDFDDDRPAAHNADGLAMLNGMSEWIWRPLSNPNRLQISAFADNSPKGFGLIQRKRKFEDFTDTNSQFQKRPSCWIEPVGNWGKGQVQLIEIPSKHEFHDNIAVFWRPAEALQQGQPLRLAYKMHWGGDPTRPQQLATIASTRVGRGTPENGRRYTVIFERQSPFSKPVQVDTWASRGALSAVTGTLHPTNKNVYIVSMELDPEGARLSELRIALRDEEQAISEVWLHRWIS